MTGFTLKKTFEKFCGYWPLGLRNSRIVQIAPDDAVTGREELRGFKFEQLARGAVSSVTSVSIPVCPGCDASSYCRPLRISLKDFETSASQARKLDHFQKLMTIEVQRPSFDVDMYLLFKQYIDRRHGHTNTDMIRFGADDYRRMLDNIEWLHVSRDRDTGKLAAFAMIDQQENAFCMEYSVYDTARAKISPGTSMILSVASLLRETHREGQLYLGSWSPESPKTGYKKDFIGAEIHTAGGWERVNRHWAPEQVPPPQITHFLK